YLRTPRPRHDIVAELQSGFAQSLDLSFEIVHLKLNPVPATGDWFTTIGHRFATGAGLPAEQQPHAVARHRRKSGARVLVDGEAEVGCVELDRDRNVVDHVADADR